MPALTTRTKSIRRNRPLRITHQAGTISVSPQDQDSFYISAEKAIAACKEVIRKEEIISTFTKEVLEPLLKWCERNQEAISACYLTTQPTALLIYVMGSTEQYNFALAVPLSELAIVFANKGWAVQLSQIPKTKPEHLSTYFGPDYSLQIFGE